MWRNLAVVGTVDPVEADTFGSVVVQDFNGVVVENRNDLAGEVGGEGNRNQTEQKSKAHDDS
jgi:hypothetical protein